MKETTLLKIALISSITGILILFIIADNLEITVTKIIDIKEEDLNKYVKVQGYVDSYKGLTGLSIMNIHDETGSIDVVMFKEEDILIYTGTLLEIEGSISEYNGELQINADSIKKIVKET